MRNLTSVILNILTYLINPPVCSQFSISATTSSPARMHSPPCWALPFHPQLPWPQCHSAWALTHNTWLPLHVDSLLVLAELLKPYLSHSHVWKPSILCLGICPQACNFDKWKNIFILWDWGIVFLPVSHVEAWYITSTTKPKLWQLSKVTPLLSNSLLLY